MALLLVGFVTLEALTGKSVGKNAFASNKVDQELVTLWGEDQGQACRVDIWLTDIDIDAVDTELRQIMAKQGEGLEETSLEYVTLEISTRRKLYEGYQF